MAEPNLESLIRDLYNHARQGLSEDLVAVSYTHLDVYKRQGVVQPNGVAWVWTINHFLGRLWIRCQRIPWQRYGHNSCLLYTSDWRVL